MKFQPRESDEQKMNLTPMIDIIFQLLIFFVLTAKFIAFEGQLQAYLPKDRGLDSGSPTIANNVTIYLEWEPEGKVICQTTNYQRDNETRQVYEWPTDSNARQVGGKWQTKTKLPGTTTQGDVVYDYASPDFAEVEDYIKYRRDSYQRAGPGSKGLPVEINFSNDVPWQAVVNIIDICKRLGITDIALTGEELE